METVSNDLNSAKKIFNRVYSLQRAENESLRQTVEQNKQLNAKELEKVFQKTEQVYQTAQQAQQTAQQSQQTAQQAQQTAQQAENTAQQSMVLSKHLPEMKMTRGLILLGQSLKDGFWSLFQSQGAKIAIGGTFLFLLITTFSNNKDILAKAFNQQEKTYHCKFYAGKNTPLTDKAVYSFISENDYQLNLVDCGTSERPQYMGTDLKELPKNGLFSKKNLFKTTK